MRKAFLVLMIAASLLLPGSAVDAFTWYSLTITESQRSAIPSVTFDDGGEPGPYLQVSESQTGPERVIGNVFDLPPESPLGRWVVAWMDHGEPDVVSDFLHVHVQHTGTDTWMYFAFYSQGASNFDDEWDSYYNNVWPYVDHATLIEDPYYIGPVDLVRACPNYPFVSENYGIRIIFDDVEAVPLPPTAYLLGSGLLGLAVTRLRKRREA